jgi:hypothetical protein
MPERSSNPGNQTENRGKGKKPHDANVFAFNIVQQAIGEKPKEHSAEKPVKNPAAVTLGRLGGLKGGKARAEKLTAKKRSEIAKKAAQTRWKPSS